MWIAMALGLTGSIGHCSGMCSGIVWLIQRSMGDREGRAAWVWVHTGRLLAYALLGFAAGSLGSALRSVFQHLSWIQGALAFYSALIGFYLVFVILGKAPGPEFLFPGLVSRWRRWFQRISGPEASSPILVVGIAWGFLPCGLVLTALFTVAVTAEPIQAAASMLVFGAATLPVLLSVRWLSARLRTLEWPRYGAAAALAVFSLQIGFRALSAFGLIDHWMIGKVMLW